MEVGMGFFRNRTLSTRIHHYGRVTEDRKKDMYQTGGIKRAYVCASACISSHSASLRHLGLVIFLAIFPSSDDTTAGYTSTSAIPLCIFTLLFLL
jgi:hypothetical protein